MGAVDSVDQRSSVKILFPGVALAILVALISNFLGPLILPMVSIPTLVIALIIGVFLQPWFSSSRYVPGFKFCVSRILRIAVALLGLRVALADIMDLGFFTGVIVLISMVLTISFGLWFAQILGLSRAFGALAGVATGVCGASAALATSTVLPDYEGKEADTVFVIIAVNLLSTFAMVIYPPVAYFFGFGDLKTGILLGGAIHDVAQVVGAGYSVNESVGAVSVTVKLFRVLLLLPVILIVGRIFLRPVGEAKVPVPIFAFAFLLLCLLNSFIYLLPDLVSFYASFKSIAGTVSTWGLLIAIAALGLGTSVQTISKLGARHIFTVIGTTLIILASVIIGLLL